MKILARGEKSLVSELREKLSSVDVSLTEIQDTDLPTIDLAPFDCIVDLAFDNHPDNIRYYAGLKGKPVLVSAVKIQLAQVVATYGREVACTLIGLNALPGFINRSLLEVSLLNNADKSALDVLMQALGCGYRLVDDRVGMVTPRIIFMIVNEACYTLQEGTASMQDIDTSMKLGTNYPHGPFEWADKIGVNHVYETLSALYEDTREERYKICPLLKTLYLKKGSFYELS